MKELFSTGGRGDITPHHPRARPKRSRCLPDWPDDGLQRNVRKNLLLVFLQKIAPFSSYAFWIGLEFFEPMIHSSLRKVMILSYWKNQTHRYKLFISGVFNNGRGSSRIPYFLIIWRWLYYLFVCYFSFFLFSNSIRLDRFWTSPFGVRHPFVILNKQSSEQTSYLIFCFRIPSFRIFS